jgi:hypothetical protein
VVLLRALQERRLVDTEQGRIAIGWLPAVARMAASGRRNEWRISTRLSRSKGSARRSLKGQEEPLLMRS